MTVGEAQPVPNETRGVWVGFDLGGTKMLGAVLDDQWRPLGKRRRKTKGHEGEQAALRRIAATIDDALANAGVDRSHLLGIGIGCPGPLDLRKGIVLEAPNLGWIRAPVKEFLEREFQCPAVVVNDVDAGVFGEYVHGSARGAHCVVGVFPGTGIGGGCVYNGRILQGVRSSCFEIGHIQVAPDGPLCGCGQRGCLEAVASRLAISAEAAKAAFRGQAPNLRAAVGTDISNIRSGALAESIAGGDEFIEAIVRKAAGQIGVAVAGVVHLLSPDVVVLGGGLVEAMPKLFVEAVDTSARSKLLPSFRNTFRVVPAKLGDDSTVVGAAAWAKRVLEDRQPAGVAP